MTYQLSSSTGRLLQAVSIGLASLSASSLAAGDVPCGGGELEECRVLIEINATDGDIGFHALLDAEGWEWAQISAPDGKDLFKEQAKGSLKDQTLTENFFESEEPLCWADPEEPDEEVVTLAEFLERFPAGTYQIRNKLPDGGMLFGWTELTHQLPAAPAEIEFDGAKISWQPGTDLGRCEPEGGSGAEGVPVAAYEVVLEPDLDAEEPADEALTARTFSVIVPAGAGEVTVPPEYLASLPADTPVKVEVLAIEQRPNGSFGNQVAAEEHGFCANEVEGCEEED